MAILLSFSESFNCDIVAYFELEDRLPKEIRFEKMLQSVHDAINYEKVLSRKGLFDLITLNIEVTKIEKIAPKAQLFRKSGSWRTYHSDSILVWGNDPNRRYILVALIDDPNGEQIIRSLVKPIERVLKTKRKS